MSAYCWLAKRNRAGDNIWLFGFSRGAYTVRSLGGMISRCGLLDPAAANMTEQQVWDAVDQIFSAYRTKTAILSNSIVFHNTAPGTNPEFSTRVHFIGVWDTVGSLGIPDDFGILKLL